MTALAISAGALVLVALCLMSFVVGMAFGAMLVAASRPEARKRADLRVVK